MEEINKIEIRSEEMQDILSRPPRWIIRWGITLLFIIVVVLLVGSYFYKYPDIIQSQVTITTVNPPASIQTMSNGKIVQINAVEKQKINKGFVIAVIENSANVNDVIFLHTMLDTMQMVEGFLDSTELKLGELQSTYSSFSKLLKDYRNALELDYFQEKIHSVLRQKADYQLYYDRLWTQKNIQENQLKLANSQFEREKMLFEKSVISKSDFEKAEKAFLSEKLSFENIRTTLVNTQMQINQLDQQILDLQLQKTQDESIKKTALEESLQNLKSQLKKWEQTYLIISPINGVVTYTQIWSVNQNVQSGEIVATIIPNEAPNIIGKVEIPAAGVGKVKVGQKVNIKLDNFPYMEFGLLRGIIKSISLVPFQTEQGAIYTAEIEIPDSLISNYGKSLKFSQEMTGTAEIITNDIRLLERFFNPIKAVWKKNIE